MSAWDATVKRSAFTARKLCWSDTWESVLTRHAFFTFFCKGNPLIILRFLYIIEADGFSARPDGRLLRERTGHRKAGVPGLG